MSDQTAPSDGFATTREMMMWLLYRVTELAGGEAPTFAIMNPRDYWYLKRGPHWRYPLPEKRSFKPLPARCPMWGLMRRQPVAPLLSSMGRRAFVPNLVRLSYTRYSTLPAWINGMHHRGRMQRRPRLGARSNV